MNKLVLIGNGFDLAHGLKTKYSDFLLSYLNSVFKTALISKYSFKDELITLNILETPYIVEFNTISDFNKLIKSKTIKVIYSNSFFKKIIETTRDFNWVDIEYLYYSTLISIFKETEGLNEFKYDQPVDEIQKLNICFDLIKSKLIEYLSSIDNKTKTTNPEIESHFNDEIYKNIDKTNDQVLLLNFNYTSTIDIYAVVSGLKKPEIINIHGRLNDEKNPIIFGYGDEKDTYYEKIERLNSNEYLSNIKSFGYFKTNNYQNLFRFLDSRNFEVYIMGHSCGISDRILLNSIFEHEKCQLIKIYYYQKEDSNDFFEKTQEISRHFSSKKEMRTKIEPFPKRYPLVAFKR